MGYTVPAAELVRIPRLSFRRLLRHMIERLTNRFQKYVRRVRCQKTDSDTPDGSCHHLWQQHEILPTSLLSNDNAHIFSCSGIRESY